MHFAGDVYVDTTDEEEVEYGWCYTLLKSFYDCGRLRGHGTYIQASSSSL